ncbi:MAG: hypothetical protein H7844_14670 [Nitrospirae bacterium YQR-1]
MRHYAADSYWNHYENLPTNIRELADKSFALLKENPAHPSLHLKKVENYWCIRIGKKYRALAVEIEEGLLWFWIGTHAQYDKLI